MVDFQKKKLTEHNMEEFKKLVVKKLENYFSKYVPANRIITAGISYRMTGFNMGDAKNFALNINSYAGRVKNNKKDRQLLYTKLFEKTVTYLERTNTHNLYFKRSDAEQVIPDRIRKPKKKKKK